MTPLTFRLGLDFARYLCHKRASRKGRVEEDVIAGYLWYEEKARGLGEEFLRMFDACANELPRDALLYQKV